MRGSWAEAQIARVQAPVYANKRRKAAAAKKRALFDGTAEYRSRRRVTRLDGKLLCLNVRWERSQA